MFGITAILLSTIFATAKDLVSKGISQEVHGNVSACTSFLFALPWYFAILLGMYFFDLAPFEYTGPFFLFVTLRAITDSVAELCKMHALALGEISFIANFFSLTPVFLIFLAPIITGDQISNLGLFGLGIIVLGTLLLLNAPSKDIPWKGVGYALLSAFFFSLNICLDRLAVRHASPIFSGFMMTLLSGLILLLPMFRIRKWKTQISTSIKPLCSRGLFEVLFMTFKLFGLRFLEPQYASGIQKLTLVFSVALGGKTFDEKDRRKRIITSLLVMIGSIVIIYSKAS